MPRPKQRTGKFRKSVIPLPGGRLAIHYSKKRVGQAKCGICGRQLHGTLRERNFRASASSKTSRRPNRPYGGNLCSACMRLKFKRSVIPPVNA